MRQVYFGVKLTVSALLSLFLIGCNLTGPQRGEPEFSPTYPEIPEISKQGNNGAIYNNQTAIALFQTPVARRVGDILTVVLVENTQGQKQADSSSDKNNTVNMPNPTALGLPVSLGKLGTGYNLNFNNNSARSFAAESESTQNNKLSGKISVTVHKVLPNGSMIVKGEKWVNINTGDEYIRLSGIVRPQDIDPDNSVTSDKVANARIAYSGVGQNHDGQVMGWLSKFLWSSIFPF